MAQAGRLLSAGESIDYNGSRFTVERLERRRIRRVRLALMPAERNESTVAALSMIVLGLLGIA